MATRSACGGCHCFCRLPALAHLHVHRATLQEKRSFTCSQLPATWGSVPTSSAKMGTWAPLSNGEGGPSSATRSARLQGRLWRHSVPAIHTALACEYRCYMVQVSCLLTALLPSRRCPCLPGTEASLQGQLQGLAKSYTNGR